MKTQAQIVAKWAERSAAAAGDYKRGVESVDVNPAAKAVEKADIWVANVIKSKDKWVRKLNAVTLASWKERTKTVGPGRYSQGVTEGKNAYAKFISAWMPFLSAAKAELDRTNPRGTVQENAERAKQWILMLAEGAMST